MHSKEFIETIKIVVEEASIKGIQENLNKPVGRHPDQKLIELSRWFNSLSLEGKSMVSKIIKESVEMSVFGFLCVLDGVRPIEDDEEKGKLELFYEKNGSRILLNDPDQEYLHNL